MGLGGTGIGRTPYFSAFSAVAGLTVRAPHLRFLRSTALVKSSRRLMPSRR